MAGRKIVDRARVKDEIINALSVGAYRQDASKSAGISEDTLARWEKADAEFAERTSRATAKAWIGDLAVIRRAALDGDWRAAGDHLDRTGSPYRKTENVTLSNGKDGAPFTFKLEVVE